MERAWNDIKVGRHLQTDLYWVRSHRWPAGHIWNGITIPAYVLWVVRSGALEVTLDGQIFNLAAGDAWLHAHPRQRSIRVLHDAQWLSLGFGATLYDHLDALEPLAPAQWRPPRRDRIVPWLEELVAQNRTRSAGSALIIDGLMRAVVGWCWESLNADLYQLMRRELPSWLERVIHTCHQRPAATVSELTRESGYSPAQFRRRFYHAMGCSPRDYLMQRRLETARHLLLTNDLSVASIAQRCGFNDPTQLTRHFKQEYGIAPLRFRQIATRQIE